MTVTEPTREKTTGMVRTSAVTTAYGVVCGSGSRARGSAGSSTDLPARVVRSDPAEGPLRLQHVGNQALHQIRFRRETDLASLVKIDRVKLGTLYIPVHPLFILCESSTPSRYRAHALSVRAFCRSAYAPGMLPDQHVIFIANSHPNHRMSPETPPRLATVSCGEKGRRQCCVDGKRVRRGGAPVRWRGRVR